MFDNEIGSSDVSSASTGALGNIVVSDDTPYVVVVGAGIAGLACALELRRMGACVALVEAREEVGGRCRSQMIGDQGCAIDLGAAWIHGIRKNPLYQAVAEAGLHCCDTGSEVALCCRGKILSGTAIDRAAEGTFNLALEVARNEGEDIARKEAGLPSNSILSAPQRVGTSLALGDALQRALLRFGNGIHDESQTLIAWHKANLEYANATNLNELSLRHWDQDDSFAFAGSHCVIREGMTAIAQALAQQFGIDFVHTKFKVTRIAFSQNVSNNSPYQTKKRKRMKSTQEEALIRVEAEDGRVVECDACVCTLPLGVLKADTVCFEPQLPPWKRAAIDRLGFGLLDKIAIRFRSADSELPKPLATTSGFATGRVLSIDEEDNSSRFFLFLNLASIVDEPLVIALTPADAADELRVAHASHTKKNPRLAEPNLVSSCLKALANLLGASPGSAERAQSQVSEAWITSWHDDEFARGSYTYIRVGSSPRDVDALAAPLGGYKLRFAGEATIKTHLATVSGAMLSGQREARRLARALGLIPAPGSKEYDKPSEISSFPARRRSNYYRHLTQPVQDLLFTLDETAIIDHTSIADASVTDDQNNKTAKARHKRCALCARSYLVSKNSVDEPSLGTFVAGDLLPFFKSDSKGIFWVHDGCCAATPDIIEVDGDYYKVETAVKRGKRITCAHCGKLGATLGCSHSQCFKSFHIKCAAIAAKWDFAIGAPAKIDHSMKRELLWSDSDDDSDDDQVPFTCLDHRYTYIQSSRSFISHTSYRRPPPRRPCGISRSRLAQLPWSNLLAVPTTLSKVSTACLFRSPPVHELLHTTGHHKHNIAQERS